MEKTLTIRDLRISFQASGGTVRAVRGVDLDLYQGETLAIVGESGSGKSVTVKAIMGIVSSNQIVEGGTILYRCRVCPAARCAGISTARILPWSFRTR